MAEVLTNELDTNELAKKFCAWMNDSYWTAHGKVFDIGIGTMLSIKQFEKGISAELSGGLQENDNGNGSLMRILPLLVYIHNLDIKERYEYIKKVSSITHAHIRSIISCFYYLEFARELITIKNLLASYNSTQKTVSQFLQEINISPDEIIIFDRLLNQNIFSFSEDEIKSSGYVLHTLEASIWCLFNSSSYQEAILKAVNLGEDTDTTACVVGGLAGLHYGYKSIPKNWFDKLARKNDIEILAERLEKKYLN